MRWDGNLHLFKNLAFDTPEMSVPLYFSLIHYSISITGTVVSSFLMVIILLKTPQHMRSYSVLLLSLTGSQLVTCFSSCILFARLIPIGKSFVGAICGPIRYTESDQVCYYLWFFMLHGHGHFIVMLTVCFLYRYYIMLKPTPTLLKASLSVVVAYLPTVTLLGASALAPISSQTFNREILSEKRPTYEFDYEVLFGVENMLRPQFLLGFLWICTSTFPCYTIILIVGRKMYTTLAANKIHMSESTKDGHREIIKGLVIQSCLPAIYCFSIWSYALGQFEILNSPVLEYSTHIFGELTVTIAPFITLYFVKPYRQAVKGIFNRSYRQNSRVNSRVNSVHITQATNISVRAESTNSVHSIRN